MQGFSVPLSPRGWPASPRPLRGSMPATCPATLAYFPAPDAELDALAPRSVRRGYRYGTAFQVGDLDVLADLTQHA
jgi:hypothetical protein